MKDIRTGKVTRRGFVVGTIAGAALLGRPAIARAQTKALKIALILPQTGFFAAAGQSCYRGAVIAPAVLADYGYHVDLSYYDDESSVAKARTQAERAIDDGAQCIVGAFESGATLAIAQVCEQRKVPLVINIAAAPQITNQGYKYVVRNFETGGQLLRNGLLLIKDAIAATKVELKTAVFLHANDTFGTVMGRAMGKLFPTAHLPFKLVETIAYDAKAQDLGVEVTKVRAVNPDVVLVITHASDAIKLIRGMVQQRFQPKAVISPGSPGLYDEEFFAALGPLANFNITTVPWVNPKAQMTHALAAAFKPAHPKFRFAVDCFNVGFTFEALLIAADGFRRARTSNGPELMSAIRATNITDHVMIGGPIKFDDKGQNNNIRSAVVQNRNLTPTVVLPPNVATMAPVLPIPPWNGRT